MGRHLLGFRHVANAEFRQIRRNNRFLRRIIGIDFVFDRFSGISRCRGLFHLTTHFQNVFFCWLAHNIAENYSGISRLSSVGIQYIFVFRASSKLWKIRLRHGMFSEETMPSITSHICRHTYCIGAGVIDITQL